LVKRKIPERLLPVVFNVNPELVGRQKEMDHLFNRLALSTSNKLQNIVITGHKGTGKRALALAFMTELQEKEGNDHIILRTKCFGDELSPYSSIGDLIKRYLHYYCDQEIVGKAIRQLLGRNEPDLFRKEISQNLLFNVFAKVTGANFTLNSDTLDYGSEDFIDERQFNDVKLLYNMYYEFFLHILKEKKIVLFIEHVQLMQKDAWNLLCFLIRQLTGRPLLLITTTGTDVKEGLDNGMNMENAHMLTNLLQEGAERLEVGPLGKESMMELFDALLPGNIVDMRAKADIVDYARGLPLLLIETVLALLDNGELFREKGVWRLDSEDGLDRIGRAFSDIMRERYLSLSDDLKCIVRNAAVLGKRFAKDELTEFAEYLGEREGAVVSMELNNLLRQLCEIHRIIREDEMHLEFGHAQIHAIIYSQIDQEVRKRLHVYVAELLERKQANEFYSRELAFHWEQGGDPSKALIYLDMLGDKMQREVAHEEAISAYERALSIVSDYSHLRDENWIFDTTRKLARLYYLTAKTNEAIRLDNENVERGLRICRFRESCDLLRIISNNYMLAGKLRLAQISAEEGRNLGHKNNLLETEHKMLLQLAIVRREQRHIQEASEMLEQCYNFAKSGARTWLYSESARQLGIIYKLQGDFQNSRDFFNEATGGFQNLTGASRQFGLSMTYDNLASLSIREGNLEMAEYEIERSLFFRKESGDIIGMSRALHTQAEVLFYKGRVTEARVKLDESLEFKKRFGDEFGIGKSLLLEGSILEASGDWAGAIRSYEKSRQVFEELSMGWQSVEAMLLLANAAAKSGDVFKLEKLLAELKAGWSDNWGNTSRIRIDLLEANLERIRNNNVGAVKLADQAILQIRELELMSIIDEAHFVKAVAMLESGEIKGAMESLRSALDALGRDGSLFTRMRYNTLLGRILRENGDYNEALEILDDSLKIMCEIGDIRGQALALDQKGKIEMDNLRPDQARLHFEKALELKRLINDVEGITLSARLLKSCK
jgi:tetratricopeptide (TPR) repeat protein